MKKLNKRIKVDEGLWLNKTNSILNLSRTINMMIIKIDEIVEWINQHEVE